MPHETLDSHISCLLEQPPPDVPTPPLWHELASFDDPPPWEPQFEELSSPSSSWPPPPPPPLLRRRPLDPPPRCFSVPSPLRIRSHDFPPFYIPAASDKLTDGFRMLYPCNVFEQHGIHRADWARFLEDLGIAARLSHEGLSAVRSRVPVTALLAHRIFPPRAVGTVYDSRFVWSAVEEVRAHIRIWNQCAFERRKIRATLQVRPAGTSGKKSYALLVESL